jgi:UDP-sugar diphosphatase
MISDELDDSNKGPIDFNKYPPKNACTLEMCAGIVDKDLPLNEIAREVGLMNYF